MDDLLAVVVDLHASRVLETLALVQAPRTRVGEVRPQLDAGEAASGGLAHDGPHATTTQPLAPSAGEGGDRRHMREAWHVVLTATIVGTSGHCECHRDQVVVIDKSHGEGARALNDGACLGDALEPEIQPALV